jgi:simple sugar transport system permease protein
MSTSANITGASRLSGHVWRPLAGSLSELPLVPVIALCILIGTFISDAFLTTNNFLNILEQSSELSILVIAESIIIITGKFDLSLESIVGVAPMMGAWLMVTSTSEGGSGLGINPYLAILVVIGTGMLVGAINGFFVVKMGITNGRTLYSLPPEYLFLGSARCFGVPISIWLAGFLYLFFGLFLRYHRLGRAIYAIGGNPAAARVAGINVDRVTWGTYILGGVLAAIAGLMLTGRIASVVSNQGSNMIFYVFASAVIGGVNLNGGRGRVLGALTGVLLLGILQNILTLSQIPAFWIDAAYGAIILVALILSWATSKKSEEL